MIDKIVNKTARVAVVDSAGATRQLLSETVKSMGFGTVQGIGTVKEVIEFLETDDLDLILCPIESQSVENGLNLLHLITRTAELRHIRVCLLVDDDEKKYLPKAFELGLLGWFSKPFTKDSLKQSFAHFLNQCEQYQANEALISAFYLRPLLEEAKEYSAWAHLYRRLLQLYPGSTELLLELAKPLLLSGERDAAVQTLQQAILLDAKLEEQAQEIFSKNGGGNDQISSIKTNGEVVNTLGIDRVVIVDPDETIQNTVEDILKEIGVSKTEKFGDGNQAAAHIKENPNPDLIIQEWRIKNLSGPMFIQRVSKEGAENTPVIILSSLVQRTDMPLLKEMGAANIIEKPFDKSEFIKSLIWTLQQERLPTEQNTLEIKIRRLLRSKKLEEAEQLIARYLEDQRIPPPRKFLIQAEWNYANRCYEDTKDLCIQALKSSADSVIALNLLGKSLMQLRDFSSALKCLEKAQNMSPQNLDRICAIAESQSELGETEAAQDSIDQAADLDPDAVAVQEAQVKVAMNGDDIEAAKTAMASLDSLDSIVAAMNNKAVALARTDRFEDSINLYEKTVEALPENKPQVKSLVLYNYALAQARKGNIDIAKEKLEILLQNPAAKIKAKASSLHQRIEQALATGTSLQLTGGSDASSNKTELGSEHLPVDTAASLEISEIMPSQGDIGCYLVFSIQNVDESIKKLLSSPIRFNPRDGISREETMKAEIGKKSA